MAVLRDDLCNLFPHDLDAKRIKEQSESNSFRCLVTPKILDGIKFPATIVVKYAFCAGSMSQMSRS